MSSHYSYLSFKPSLLVNTSEHDIAETHAKLHTRGVHRMVYPDINQLNHRKALYTLHTESVSEVDEGKGQCVQWESVLRNVNLKQIIYAITQHYA